MFPLDLDQAVQMERLVFSACSPFSSILPSYLAVPTSHLAVNVWQGLWHGTYSLARSLHKFFVVYPVLNAIVVRGLETVSIETLSPLIAAPLACMLHNVWTIAYLVDQGRGILLQLCSRELLHHQDQPGSVKMSKQLKAEPAAKQGVAKVSYAM